MVFVLIGLQLPGILRGMQEDTWPNLLLYALVINATCILVRLVWVFPGAYVPRWVSPYVRKREVNPEWRQVFIVAGRACAASSRSRRRWRLRAIPGSRAGISSSSSPSAFILTTLVFQGLTLPPLIRYLGVGDDGSAGARRWKRVPGSPRSCSKKSPRRARKRNTAAPSSMRSENTYRERALILNDDLANQLGWSDQKHHYVNVRRLRRAMVHAQRQALLAMRRSGQIGDDVMHKIEHELDLDEARLKI